MADEQTNNATPGETGDMQQQNADQNTDTPPAKGENMIPKARFDEVNAKRKAAEQSLSSVVESLKEDIPEQFRTLVPDLGPAETIKWIQEANKTGLFKTTAPANGPDSKRPGGKPSVDFTNMTPLEMRRAGYK